jgi:hypothetical protein
MIKINNRKDLIFYFRDQIEEMGFATSIDTTRTWIMNGGLLEKYFVNIEALGYIDDAWMIKISHSSPWVVNGRAIAYGSKQIKEIAIGRITMYSTMELDILNINELLEYIKNIDVVKNHLRKNKLKRINGRLGIKI